MEIKMGNINKENNTCELMVCAKEKEKLIFEGIDAENLTINGFRVIKFVGVHDTDDGCAIQFNVCKV